MNRVGFEPTKHTAGDLKSPPFDRSGTCPELTGKGLEPPDYESDALAAAPSRYHILNQYAHVYILYLLKSV